MTKETAKTKFLFSETQMRPGTLETNPTRVAPNPNETNKAGSAQQMSVPKDVKREKNETQRFLLSGLFTFNFFYSISSVF